MNTTCGTTPGSRLFTGLTLLGVGVILLLGNLDVFDLRQHLARYWPIVLVIIGTRHLLFASPDMPRVGGAFWIGTGLLFLATTLGYINIAIPRLIWPVMLIWLGLSLFMGIGCGSNPAGKRNHQGDAS